MPPILDLPRESASPVRNRRERKRSETRDRILHAALHLFAQKGLSATTIEEITQKADVGKGTFFNYFPSKEHVLQVAGQFQLAGFQAFTQDAIAKNESPETVLRRMVRSLADDPLRTPTMIQAFFLGVLGNASARKAWLDATHQFLRLLAELFGAAQRHKKVGSGLRPQELANNLHDALLGTMLRWSLEPNVKLRTMLDSTFNVFRHRIQAQPHTEKVRKTKS